LFITLNNMDTIRFSGLPWYNAIQSKRIHIIGAGGIGSWTALFVSRLYDGISKITVYDNDLVDNSNMGGQFYSSNDINELKVRALQQNLMRFSNCVNYLSIRINENSVHNIKIFDNDIIIIAVDNMETRKLICNYVENYYTTKGYFIPIIDGRMLAESYQIISVDSIEKLESYKNTLFKDTDVADLACSMKATTFCGAGIASDITALFINIVYNEEQKDNIREVPFMINKHFDLMYYDFTIPKIFQTEELSICSSV